MILRQYGDRHMRFKVREYERDYVPTDGDPRLVKSLVESMKHCYNLGATPKLLILDGVNDSLYTDPDHEIIERYLSTHADSLIIAVSHPSQESHELVGKEWSSDGTKWIGTSWSVSDYDKTGFHIQVDDYHNDQVVMIYRNALGAFFINELDTSRSQLA